MLRGKLADEGMLKEDICLGTKATTQRSDTWKTKVKPASFSFFGGVFFFMKLLLAAVLSKVITAGIWIKNV